MRIIELHTTHITFIGGENAILIQALTQTFCRIGARARNGKKKLANRSAHSTPKLRGLRESLAEKSSNGTKAKSTVRRGGRRKWLMSF